MANLHRTALRWLSENLKELRDCVNVVVTHHAPSIASVPEEERNDPVSSAYASNLEDFIKKHNIALWIHGHIHRFAYYRIGKCTVICNPRGYPGENSGFQEKFTIDVGA